MRKPGILVICHGSRENGWVALVDETVAAVKSSLPAEVPVEAAFLELVEGRLIQDGIDRLESIGVTHMLAIPLFVSAGSTHVDEIGWALGAYAAARLEADLPPMRVAAALTYGRPMHDDPEVADILLTRLSALSAGKPADECVLLIGHGSEHPGFHEAWRDGLTALATAVKNLGGYADAAIGMLRPDGVADAVRSLRERRPGAAILAVPVFLGEGYFTNTVIPRRLDGLGCRYDGRTLMPHPGVGRWVIRQANAWLQGFHA